MLCVLFFVFSFSFFQFFLFPSHFPKRTKSFFWSISLILKLREQWQIYITFFILNLFGSTLSRFFSACLSWLSHTWQVFTLTSICFVPVMSIIKVRWKFWPPDRIIRSYQGVFLVPVTASTLTYFTYNNLQMVIKILVNKYDRNLDMVD